MARVIFASIVALLFVWVAYPLITPVAMAGVFAVVLFPLLKKLENRKVPTWLGSGVITAGVFTVLFLPLTLLIFFIAKTGFQQLQAWRESPGVPRIHGGVGWIEAFLDTSTIKQIIKWVTNWFPIGQREMVEGAHELIRSIALKLGDMLGDVTSRLPGMIIALIIVLVSLYFFLLDGRHLVAFLKKNSFFNGHQTDRLLRTLGSICSSVILASLVSGTVQSMFETIVCLLAGVPNPMLIGSLVFIGSFIPIVGSAPVTLGVSLHQFFLGNTSVAIILFCAALVVLLLDNLIRPLFLKGSANLHPLLAFVAAFGGLQVIGFAGIFLGPIIAAVFIAIVHISVQKDEA
ncbi:MAG: AI-2E family transporter [Bdellovibrionota bacterium]